MEPQTITERAQGAIDRCNGDIHDAMQRASDFYLDGADKAIDPMKSDEILDLWESTMDAMLAIGAQTEGFRYLPNDPLPVRTVVEEMPDDEADETAETTEE